MRGGVGGKSRMLLSKSDADLADIKVGCGKLWPKLYWAMLGITLLEKS